MYELERVNQNIINNYFNCIAKEVKRKNKILILQAIKYAVKKMLPNEMDKLLEPKIRQVGKTLDIVFERKIEKFNSIEEAQQLFIEQFPEAYDHAFDNPNEEFSQMVMMAYDLCKYDSKLTYKGETSFFNIPFILHSFRQHYKAKRYQA